MTKTITTRQGTVAWVDDDDYDYLTRFSWHCTPGGYFWRRLFRGRALYMHREIMGNPKGLIVHHRNHNTLDNRKSNLAICDSSQHNGTRRKAKGCGSNYKGVYWHKRAKKWSAEVSFRGRKYYLGLFLEEKEAAQTYDHMAKKLFGSFARTNFENE